MNDRVKDDDAIGRSERPDFIESPIIIVHNIGGGRQGYLICAAELDPALSDPTKFGVILSDLVDHVAAAYRHTTGRDERDIRAHIIKVMRDEDRFKEKDPTRGKLTGATIKPPSN